MHDHDQVDEETQKHLSKIKELVIQLEKLENDEKEFLREFNITEEEISSYLDKKENFSEEEWQELAQQKKLLDDKLKNSLAAIRDPRKAKRSYSSLQNVQRHWLHVR